MKTTKILTEIKNENLFEIAGVEFIKFAEVDGVVYAVTKNSLFNSEFGSNNNYADIDNKIRKRLEIEFLPKIEEAIGAENVLEFETDLISLDGLTTYGKYKSKVGLPTFDFCRANVKTFDKYKLNKWWWLSTPDTTPEHRNNWWVVCVSPSGYVSYFSYDNVIGGVRPIWHFVSSISVSCEE